MNNIVFILTGFVVVLLVLSLLWLVCIAIGWLHRGRHQNRRSPTELAGPAQAPIPSAHLAAIAAAISAVLPGKYRIVRVFAPGHTSSNWIEEGRFEMSASHRVRWDWPVLELSDSSIKAAVAKKSEKKP